MTYRKDNILNLLDLTFYKPVFSFRLLFLKVATKKFKIMYVACVCGWHHVSKGQCSSNTKQTLNRHYLVLLSSAIIKSVSYDHYASFGGMNSVILSDVLVA